MPKPKKPAKIVKIAKKPEKKFEFPLGLNVGSLSFLGIIVVSAIAGVFQLQTNLSAMVLALFGAIIAIENIKKEEEKNYMIAVTALLVVIVMFLTPAFFSFPGQIKAFLVGISIAFGISGFIVAMGKILKMAWD